MKLGIADQLFLNKQEATTKPKKSLSLSDLSAMEKDNSVTLDQSKKSISNSEMDTSTWNNNSNGSSEKSVKKSAPPKRSLSLSDMSIIDTDCSVLDNTNKSSSNSEIATTSDCKVEFFENWRNKALRSPKSGALRRTKNSISNRHDLSYVQKSIPILSYGFESKTRIVATEFKESKCMFAEYIRDLIQKQQKKHSLSHYEKRNEILFDIFSSKVFYKSSIHTDENVLHMSCRTGIGSFFARLV